MAQSSPMQVLQAVENLKEQFLSFKISREEMFYLFTCVTIVATVCSVYSCLVAK